MSDEIIKKCVYMYKLQYHSAIRKDGLVLCYNMDRTAGFYAKWKQADRQGQKLDDATQWWYIKNKAKKCQCPMKTSLEATSRTEVAREREGDKKGHSDRGGRILAVWWWGMMWHHWGPPKYTFPFL